MKQITHYLMENKTAEWWITGSVLGKGTEKACKAHLEQLVAKNKRRQRHLFVVSIEQYNETKAKAQQINLF